MSVNSNDVKTALKRVHYLRVLNRLNRITALIRRGCMVLSVCVMAVNMIGIVRTLGRAQ